MSKIEGSTFLYLSLAVLSRPAAQEVAPDTKQGYSNEEDFQIDVSVVVLFFSQLEWM